MLLLIHKRTATQLSLVASEKVIACPRTGIQLKGTGVGEGCIPSRRVLHSAPQDLVFLHAPGPGGGFSNLPSFVIQVHVHVLRMFLIHKRTAPQCPKPQFPPVTLIPRIHIAACPSCPQRYLTRAA